MNEQQTLVAYHEAGHATALVKLGGGIERVTIRPTGNTYGRCFAASLPDNPLDIASYHLAGPEAVRAYASRRRLRVDETGFEGDYLAAGRCLQKYAPDAVLPDGRLNFGCEVVRLAQIQAIDIVTRCYGNIQHLAGQLLEHGTLYGQDCETGVKYSLPCTGQQTSRERAAQVQRLRDQYRSHQLSLAAARKRKDLADCQREMDSRQRAKRLRQEHDEHRRRMRGEDVGGRTPSLMPQGFRGVDALRNLSVGHADPASLFRRFHLSSRLNETSRERVERELAEIGDTPARRRLGVRGCDSIRQTARRVAAEARANYEQARSAR